MDAYNALPPSAQLKFWVVVVIGATIVWIWIAKRIGKDFHRGFAVALPVGAVIGMIAFSVFFPPAPS